MLKKICCIAVVICAVFMAATSLLINSASSQDIWVDTKDGIAYYVMNETFIDKTQDKTNRRFTVDVKIVRDNEAVIKNFSFIEDDGLIQYSVDGGDKNSVDKGTAAYSIWEFSVNYLGIDY